VYRSANWIAGAAAIGVLTLAAGPATASPGDPVNQFNFEATEVALQSGKTIIAGTADTDLGLIRLNADGSPDASFDVEGFNRADFGSSETAADMALGPGGKIVIAGTQDPGATPVAVLASFNPDGSPDTSFSGDGKATLALAAGDVVTSVDVRAGRIAVGVKAGSGDFKVIAFTATGAADAGFGSGGVASINFGGTDQTTAVAFQSTGKLIAAGGTSKSTGDFAIARFGLNGTIDNAADVDPAITFNGAGAQEIDASGGGPDQALGMAIDASDRIVLSGVTGNGAFGPKSGTVRLGADGAWETTFAGDGKAEFPEGLFSHFAYDVAVAGTGDIIVAGIGYEAAGLGYVQRLSSSGSQTFSSMDSGADAYDTVSSMHVAAASDGGFTLGGNASEYPAVTPGAFGQRFTPANALDPTLAGDGTTFPRFLEQAPPAIPPATQPSAPQPAAGAPGATATKCKKKRKKGTGAATSKKCKQKKRR
jgi:uncharacterized delta-60 repeat protein